MPRQGTRTWRRHRIFLPALVLALIAWLALRYRNSIVRHRNESATTHYVLNEAERIVDWAPETVDDAPAYIREAVASIDERIESSAHAQSEDAEWIEAASPPSSQCLLRIKPNCTEVRAAVDTASQAADFELLRRYRGAVSGALPLFLEIGDWPRWFPFCRTATLLGQWSSAQLSTPNGGDASGHRGRAGALENAWVWHVTFQIGLLISIDSVVVAVETLEGLVSEGWLHHYLFTPQTEYGAYGDQRTVMGLNLPSTPGRTLFHFRAPVSWARTSFKPLTSTHGLVTHSNELVNLVPPIEWAIKLFWRTLCTRAIGIMAQNLDFKMITPSPERAAFYQNMEAALQTNLQQLNRVGG